MGLKERLQARVRPQLDYRLRIDDVTDLLAEVDAADSELRLARRRDPESEATSQAEERLDAAKAALEQGYETFRITALPPADMEALIAAHPPTDQQRQEGAAWNVDTFRPAMFAECIDSDMTEQDWAEFITKGPVSWGEVSDLWAVTMSINSRFPDSRIPKG